MSVEYALLGAGGVGAALALSTFLFDLNKCITDSALASILEMLGQSGVLL